MKPMQKTKLGRWLSATLWFLLLVSASAAPGTQYPGQNVLAAEASSNQLTTPGNLDTEDALQAALPRVAGPRDGATYIL